MSVQNKEKEQDTMWSKFLVNDNKFVYYVHPNCNFLKVRFENRIGKTRNQTLDIENYPVGLVTVLGSGKNQTHASIAHTLGLIEFLQNVDQPQLHIQETRVKLDNSGIYIWPTKYMITKKDSSKMVVLVLYVHGNECEVLENFAAVACSNIFVFDDTYKESLQARINEILYEVKKQPAIISVCPAELLSLYYDKTELVPIKGTNGSDLLFKDLRLFLQSVEDKINATSSSDSKCFTKSSSNDGENIAALTNQTFTVPTGPLIREDKFTDSICHMEVEKNPQVSSEKNKRHPQQEECEAHSSEIMNVVSSEKNICKELQCYPLIKKLQRLLENWVSKSLTPENISSMLLCYQEHYKDDKHNIKSEILDLVKILTLYNDQICNLYDNYVCFEGDIDVTRFNQLVEAAYCRSSETLAAKNHIHSMLTNNILNKASSSLHSYYAKINQDIITSEQGLAQVVSDRLVHEYKIKVMYLLSHHANPTFIRKTHILLRNMVISTGEKSMNMDDRLNEVAKTNLSNLKCNLDLEFRKLVEASVSTSKTEHSSQALECYIEDYLVNFYAKALPALHEQTVEELSSRHDNVLKNLTFNTQYSQIQSLLLRFDMHLLYITEVINQEHTNRNTSTISNSKPFCLYLTPTWYAVYYKTHKGIEYINYGNANSRSPAFVARTNSGNILFDHDAQYVKEDTRNIKTCDSILNYVKRPNVGFKYNRLLIEKFFDKILSDVEKVFNQKNTGMILVIPSSLNVGHRIRLRRFAISAGMKHVFIADEVSLLAYNQLCLNNSSGNSKVQVVLSMEVSNKGIRVKIFEEKSKNCIQLSAISFQVWQAGSEKHNSSWSCINETKKITNPFSHDNPNSDCIITLRGAILAAFSQIDASVQRKSLKYCIISEFSKHHNVFDEVFIGRTNRTKIVNQYDHVLSAAMHFSNSPYNLVTDILDHGLNTPYFEELGETILKPYMQLGLVPQHLDAPNDSDLIERKGRLIKKCGEMRVQLSNGKVAVRRLLRKLITESIERAENVASDVYTTKEILLAEDQELNELIGEHNFKIFLE